MTKHSHLSPLTSHLKVAFLGTPEIAATILDDLLESGLNIESIVTQPDRPCGRGKVMQESPVKSLAIDHHIPVYQPADKSELTAAIKEIAPDICIVAAYGMIIPREALEVPRLGMINFHPSLLPLLRGPSPIPMAIMCGHKKTGVTIIQVAEKMDAGDILDQAEVKLSGKETTPSLSNDLAHLGSSMIIELIPKIEKGDVSPRKQDERKATHSQIIKKTDGEVLFQKYHATNIEQAARAFTPWPGIYTTWNGKKVDLFDVETLEGKFEPGMVIQKDSQLIIGCAQGAISVDQLKLEGKNKVTAEDFLRGYRDFIGSKLA